MSESFAMRRSGIPDWRVPKNSPGPLILRSSSARLEAVVRLLDYLHTLECDALRVFCQQDAVGLVLAPAHAAPELV